MNFIQQRRDRYFELKYLPDNNLPTVTVNGKRHYVTPEGDQYPSVTTVLSSMSADGIAAWRAKVGAEAANKVSVQASGRGTKVHQLAEDYLRNKDDYLEGHMPANIETFNQIKTYVDKHVDVVYGNEIALYSDELKTAGRCDLIAEMHGKKTIGDFKTSKKFKKEEWILNYFYQCTAYALMLYEREQVWCPQICLMIATDEDGLQPVIKRTNDYVPQVREFFDNWHKNK